MAPDTYNFIGYGSLPYQDWLNRSLMQYVSSKNVMGEGGYADPWVSQLTDSLGSPEALNSAVQGIGGYGAIGFDPNAVWNQQMADYARTGHALSRDANGNVSFPMFNTATVGSDLGKRLGLPGGLSFGGSEGEGLGELASLIEMGALSYGGAVAGGATAGGTGASSTAGFGEAGYAGSAGSAGAGGSAGATGSFDQGASNGVFDSYGNPLYSSGEPVPVAGGGSGGFGGGDGGLGETGAFDQSASQGVFDSSGNPLYNGEQGMWDWLDGLDNGDSFDFGNFGVDENSSSANTVGNGANETGAFDQFGSNVGPDSDQTIFGGTSSNPFGDMSLTDIITKYGQKGYDLIKGLIARSGSGGSTGGGILGGVLNDPIGAAFNATPFLLALNEANKQSKDLNSVLGGINGAAYTKSVLDPYDIDTGTGRAALQNDMALRQIAGSSFGNTQLNNYDYTRALGRSDMATKAQLAAAQLQGNLINQRNTNRNLLLGAGLNASGKLFAPQQDPFNLRALLGV